MTGRTNYGGGGIALNANVVNKEIKSGNIIAGDFVEYYSEPTYIEQTQNVNFVFYIYIIHISIYTVTTVTTF